MYTLNITNDSHMDPTFVVFQKPPAYGPELYSLAWKTARISPRMHGRMTWQNDYNFVATAGGSIVPGVIVVPATTAPANLQGANAITLEPNMMFNGPHMGQPNAFTIQTSGGVQQGRCGVGIGKSGSSLFIAPAMPNLAIVIPEPGNEYFIGFGNYQEGEVIDYQRLMMNSAMLNFQEPGQTINVTLNATGSWTVQ